MTGFALIAVAIAALQITRKITDAKSYSLGLRGERAVAEILDDLRETGAKIIHDVPCDHANIDHVVVCRKAVFIIETKTVSKPAKKPPAIEFDGKQFTVDGRDLRYASLDQIEHQRSCLQKLLSDSTTLKVDIQPIVTFPGRYVIHHGKFRSNSVWALNPAAIQAFVANMPDRLSEEQVAMLTLHLSQYVRNFKP